MTNKVDSIPAMLKLFRKYYKALRKLEKTNAAVVAMYEKQAGMIDKLQQPMTSESVKEFLQITSHSQLAKAKTAGLPFHNIEGVGPRFLKIEVVRWLETKPATRQARLNVAAAM